MPGAEVGDGIEDGAHDNRARRLQPRDDHRAPIGHPILEDIRPAGRAVPLGRREVLDGDRNAVQRAQRHTGGPQRVRLLRGLQRLVGQDKSEAAEQRVDLADPRQDRFPCLARGDPPLTDLLG